MKIIQRKLIGIQLTREREPITQTLVSARVCIITQPKIEEIKGKCNQQF